MSESLEQESLQEEFDKSMRSIESTFEADLVAPIVGVAMVLGPTLNSPEEPIVATHNPDKCIFYASSSKPVSLLMLSLLNSMFMSKHDLERIYTGDLPLPDIEQMREALVTSDNRIFAELIRSEQKLLGDELYGGYKFNGATFNNWEIRLLFHKILGRDTDMTLNGANIFEHGTVDNKHIQTFPTKIWNGGNPIDLLWLTSLILYPDEAVRLLRLELEGGSSRYGDETLSTRRLQIEVFRRYVVELRDSLFKTSDSWYPFRESALLPKMQALHSGFSKEAWGVQQNYMEDDATPQKGIPEINTTDLRNLSGALTYIPFANGSGRYLALAHNFVLREYPTKEEAKAKIEEITGEIAKAFEKVAFRFVF